MDSEDPQISALRMALEQAVALGKSQERELTAQQEINALLRDKIRELEKVPRNEFNFWDELRGSKPSMSKPKSAPSEPLPDTKPPPKSAWARFYHWFREA
jgi:hypothetical protein